MLLGAALIWGAAFTAQSVGMDYLGPVFFNGARFYVGALTLLPVVIFRCMKYKKDPGTAPSGSLKKLLLTSLLCGFLLALATTVQQIGLISTPAGKAGFITSLYVVLVPVYGLLLGKKQGARLWISVVIAVVGLYLLCVSESFSINGSDILIIVCAFVFAMHIMTVDRLAGDLDGIILSCIQFVVAGTLCMIVLPFSSETVTLEGIRGAVIPLLYTGVFSSGIAYTLQIVGQQHTSPTVASLLLSVESVFAALIAWLVISDPMTLREIIGGSLSFTAVVISQLPGRKTA